MGDPDALLDLVGIGKTYASRKRGFYGFGPKRRLRALDDVTLRIGRGEIVGLVGESGSGKSISLRAILGLLPQGGSITGGHVWFHSIWATCRLPGCCCRRRLAGDDNDDGEWAGSRLCFVNGTVSLSSAT